MKVITVCDTPPYGHAPTYQISLTYLERQQSYGPDKLRWEEAEEEEEEEEEEKAEENNMSPFVRRGDIIKLNKTTKLIIQTELVSSMENKP